MPKLLRELLLAAAVAAPWGALLLAIPVGEMVYSGAACPASAYPGGGNRWQCLEFWLNRYQTLLTGILAVVGAGAGVWAILHQINRQQAQFDEQMMIATAEDRSALGQAAHRLWMAVFDTITSLRIDTALARLQFKMSTMRRCCC